MSGADRDTERTIERLAHAFTPAEWSGPALVIGIVVFAAVLVLTVVQRALVVDSAVGWAFTTIHGAIVVVIVPLLSVRTVREWRALRADQASIGVPE
jgi:hypothetical protein